MTLTLDKLTSLESRDAPQGWEAGSPVPLAIQTRNLTKHFGETRALEGLDLEVHTGTVFGFLGPNGAGKTTTIRLLLDLIRPTSGSASVLGLDVNRDSLEVRGRCGYLPGELKLPPRRTPKQFLAYMGRLRGGVDPDRIHELSDRLGLNLDRRIGDQSKGNRQKVGIVAAFMSDPELLILDEPTSGLDPLRQLDVMNLMREAAESGRTVLLSSHDLDQVEHVANRVGIIRDGRLVALEDVSTLRDRAVREVVVHFEGEVPYLSPVEGVFVIESGSDFLRLRVTGHMDGLIKALARSTVTTLSSSKPELDEIFLSYYGGSDDR